MLLVSLGVRGRRQVAVEVVVAPALGGLWSLSAIAESVLESGLLGRSSIQGGIQPLRLLKVILLDPLELQGVHERLIAHQVLLQIFVGVAQIELENMILHLLLGDHPDDLGDIRQLVLELSIVEWSALGHLY